MGIRIHLPAEPDEVVGDDLIGANAKHRDLARRRAPAQAPDPDDRTENETHRAGIVRPWSTWATESTLESIAALRYGLLKPRAAVAHISSPPGAARARMSGAILRADAMAVSARHDGPDLGLHAARGRSYQPLADTFSADRRRS